MRKAISRDEVGCMELSKLREKAGEIQKKSPGDKEKILGKAEREAMEMENVAEQVKQGWVGLKVLDQNMMVDSGEEQAGTSTRTEGRWKEYAKKVKGEKGETVKKIRKMR